MPGLLLVSALATGGYFAWKRWFDLPEFNVIDDAQLRASSKELYKSNDPKDAGRMVDLATTLDGIGTGISTGTAGANYSEDEKTVKANGYHQCAKLLRDKAIALGVEDLKRISTKGWVPSYPNGMGAGPTCQQRGGDWPPSVPPDYLPPGYGAPSYPLSPPVGSPAYANTPPPVGTPAYAMPPAGSGGAPSYGASASSGGAFGGSLDFARPEPSVIKGILQNRRVMPRSLPSAAPPSTAIYGGSGRPYVR